jgi:quercetin dioxygenase-like cupin family protein
VSERESRIVRWGAGRWPELPVRRYREDESGAQVTRRLLVGDGDAGLAGELRFFEVAAGESTRFERHDHAHAVVVLTGRGHVRLGEELHAIEAFDLVYVAPLAPHRFLADRGEALGFLCLVDRARDRPEELSE